MTTENLNRAVRPIPAKEETVTVKIKVNWLAVLTCLAGMALAFALGMMVQFSILAPLVMR